MAHELPTDSPRWQWRWKDMCGPDGFIIWSPQHHDIGLCFQQLCLHIPILIILAILSAYYFGRQANFVIRDKCHLKLIKLRCLVVLLLALLPILQLYIDVNDPTTHIRPIHILLSGVESLTWLTHLGYVLALRKRLGLSARGPVSVGIIWASQVALRVISLRSHVLMAKEPNPSFSVVLAYWFSIVMMSLQAVYAITLLPSEGNTVPCTAFTMNYSRLDEQEPLLSSTNSYHRFAEELDPGYLGVAMENASWISKLIFYWVNPLMSKGVKGKLLNSDDLFDLPDDLNCAVISSKIEKALQSNVPEKHKPPDSVINGGYGSTSQRPTSLPEVVFSPMKKISLFKALHICFGIQFYSIGVLKLIGDCAGFAGPLLLYRLVNFIEDKSEDIKLGYMYAAGLFVSSIIAAFCKTQFNFLMALVGLKIRAALMATVYKKTLAVGSTTLNTAFSMGEIVNFMSTDTDRIVNSCPSFHAFWSIPFQLSVTLYLLYEQVGISFLAGLAFTIILIPINKVLASRIGDLSTKMMKSKDGRVKMMTEVLRGIRAIKLHVWESHFIRIITKQRDEELKHLKGRKYLDAVCVFFWAVTTVLISILTFITYVLLGHELTAAVVFTSMALLNMLTGPLNGFPWVLNGLTEAWVSLKRIQRLLDLPDLDFDAYYNNTILENDRDAYVIMKKSHFNWGKLLSPHEIRRNSLLQRSARDKGKGKKSLTSNDSVNTRESQSRSLGRLSEDRRMSEVHEFHLRSIDLTVKKGEFIGVMGQVGSGKSALLTAILAELNKLDGDIAVVGIEFGFGYVAQQPWLQRGTIRDNILFGKAYDDVRYKKVLNACCLSEDMRILPAGDLTGVGEGGVTLSGGQKARVALARAVYQDKPIYLLDDVISAVDVNVAKHIFQHCILGILRDKTRILCTHHTQYLVHSDRVVLMENGIVKKEGKPNDIVPDYDEYILPDLEMSEGSHIHSKSGTTNVDTVSTNSDKDNDSILEEETRYSGTVKLSVYGVYWKAVGHCLSVAVILSLVLMQTSRNMTDWWLSYWVSNRKDNSSTNFSDFRTVPVLWSTMTETDKNFMNIYGLLVGLNSVFTLFRSFLFAYGGICAAERIHKCVLRSIMKSKITFFDVSPLGRILNRFSSDTYTVDDSLPFILNILLAQLFGLIGSIVITVYGLPWLCLLLAPIVPIYHWIQNNYRLTSRELKRLSSVTLSPVYNHFNETLQGLSTIRALRVTQRFRRDNEENIEANQKAQFASQAASQWLGLRLQFIGVTMITGVGVTAVVQHQFDVADPGLVGLAISYALSVTSLLNGLVNAFTETERELIAVERINQYVEEIAPETTDVTMDPPYGWPFLGVVEFENVVLKYREHLAPALKGVSFVTRPAEKVGVVGRTGAGKSSLFMAIFRLTELHSGSVIIDTVDISQISLPALRSRLSIIPQEPFLFSGTVRENLDPLTEFTEAELWSALRRVNLTPTVRQLGGLYAVLTSGGSNLSVGQRQLFCLARAVLHNAKVLCIDEATANVDQETDRQIQLTLRSAFHQSTVITIAHRVQTVLDCDRVLVMGDGQVLEFDSPDNLLSDPNSHFSKLVNHDS